MGYTGEEAKARTGRDQRALERNKRGKIKA